MFIIIFVIVSIVEMPISVHSDISLIRDPVSQGRRRHAKVRLEQRRYVVAGQSVDILSNKSSR